MARANDDGSRALAEAAAAGHLEVSFCARARVLLLLLLHSLRVLTVPCCPNAAISRRRSRRAAALSSQLTTAMQKGLPSAGAPRARAQVCELLLSLPRHAARADHVGSRALKWAAAAGHAGVARLLLGQPRHAARADDSMSFALCEAAAGGHLEVVKALLVRGTHPSSSFRSLSRRPHSAGFLCGSWWRVVWCVKNWS